MRYCLPAAKAMTTWVAVGGSLADGQASLDLAMAEHSLSLSFPSTAAGAGIIGTGLVARGDPANTRTAG